MARQMLRPDNRHECETPKEANISLITHVLLPTIALWRRRDVAEVIGEVLYARFVEDKSRAALADDAGVHPDTVRSWVRRFRVTAPWVRALFTTWAHDLDASLGPIGGGRSTEADALEAIGVAASAAARRLGPAPLWQFAAGVSGGRLLSNTSFPLPHLA